MAVLLAALMSTLDAMINVTSSVVINDFLKRYFVKNLKEKQLVRLGQIASLVVLTLGFLFSLLFDHIISAWEVMIFVVVTMILVPATFRWHWWRYSASAFVWSMIMSALVVISQKIFFNNWPISTALATTIIASFIVSVIFGFIIKPADKEVLIKFYSRIRPFGFWKPIRNEAVNRGLIPAGDPLPAIDALNGLITMVFQFGLALVPFYFFLRQGSEAMMWSAVVLILAIILYFTWYKNLPAKNEV
jgi:Na+/proline symporter